jgi:YidC/Oxa1 family membrane protein insertase
MFHNLIVLPIFNLLVFIIALIPGHNFGIALIIFTILVRFLMWPIVRKQLHHSKAMRDLQPEIKRVKKEAKGDRQKESLMLMNLYKERNISPAGSIGTLIIQFIVLLGLYFGVRNLVNDPHTLINSSYDFLHNLPYLKDLAVNINGFDETLVGLIDLTKPALGSNGLYFPALILVIGSAVAQYKQSVQLMPAPKDGRGLKQILKDASTGTAADQTEVSAAVMRSTRFLIPAMILFFTIGLPSALSLYWMVGGIVAYFQQGRILKEDEEEMEAIADTPSGTKKVVEGEVVEKPTKPKAKKSKSSKSKKKRR